MINASIYTGLFFYPFAHYITCWINWILFIFTWNKCHSKYFLANRLSSGRFSWNFYDQQTKNPQFFFSFLDKMKFTWITSQWSCMLFVVCCCWHNQMLEFHAHWNKVNHLRETMMMATVLLHCYNVARKSPAQFIPSQNYFCFIYHENNSYSSTVPHRTLCQLELDKLSFDGSFTRFD